MKILHICSFLSINRMYNLLFNEIQLLDIENIVFIPCKSNYIPKEKIHNMHYYPAYSSGNNIFEKLTNIINKYIFYKKQNDIYKNLLDKIDINDISCIHAHSLFDNGYLAYKLNKEYKKEYIVAVRNTDVNVYLKRAVHLRKVGIDILRNAKYIVFISESYRDFILEKYIPKDEREWFCKKSLVIPNGVDKFWIESGKRSSKRVINRKDVRLVQVGRIDKNKNVETTIKICKKLNEVGIKASLKIIGDGPLKDSLEKKYFNEEFIEFLGTLTKEEIKKEYHTSDIFVMPSKHETFGLVYVEAMTNGLPIIYTRDQGFDKYFEDGEVGYSIECNDVEYGVQCIIKILQNYKKISDNAAEKSKKFSWELIAKEYEKIYIDNGGKL